MVFICDSQHIDIEVLCWRLHEAELAQSSGSVLNANASNVLIVTTLSMLMFSIQSSLGFVFPDRESVN